MKWLSLALSGALCVGCAVPPRREVEPPPPPPPRIEDPVVSEGSTELAFGVAEGGVAELRALLSRVEAELTRAPLSLADSERGVGKVRLEASVAESVFRAAHAELSESARAEVVEEATPGEWRGEAVVTFGLEPPRLRAFVYLALAAVEERAELRDRLLAGLEQALVARASKQGAERLSLR